MIKNCVICGKEFQPTTKQITCSEECRKINSKKYHKKYFEKTYQNDPSYREIYRRKQNEKIKERYHNEPDYREHIINLHKTQTYREHHNKRQKECYHNSPGYKEKQIAYNKSPENRARQQKKKNERYKNDPEFRERMKRQSIKRTRELGFIPLNKETSGTVAHHIDDDHVLFIPEWIHKSVPSYPREVHRQKVKEELLKHEIEIPDVNISRGG